MKIIWFNKENRWKDLFPIFDKHPEIIYLDNAASTQKPKAVIQWVSDFLKNDYANIHRGLYPLSDKSEELYYKSKCALAKLINSKPSEIIYSYNSTYCLNLLAQALANSWKLWKWDKVLLWIWEHHSNILPWKALSKIFWFNIEFVNEDKNYNIDWKDFDKKLDKHVKVISFSHVSNVTWQIMQVEKVREKVWENTFFIIDWSQSVPHIAIDIENLKCDALIMTWHKMMAQTWLGMMYIKHDYIRTLNPLILWGWTVKDVSTDNFSLQNNVDKWEAWTPNIIWAVSLIKAIETIESLGWMEKIQEHESTLINALCEWFRRRKNLVEVIWSLETNNRVWTFSFIIKNNKNFNQLWELFAKQNIYIRTWWHCAYPLHKSLNIWWSARVSTYIYNTLEDIEKFFKILDSIL